MPRFLERIVRTIGKLTRRRDRPASGRDFEGSAAYWAQRYATGGKSGAGSYGRLAEFKAEIVNEFVRSHRVKSVIEFGSGDGNQLSLMHYPSYIGVDVSPTAVARCEARFADDSGKRFVLLDQAAGERAELALSLDVIYHLVEDATFQQHMEMLFASAERYVIIYSSNREAEPGTTPPHVRHRRFSAWIEENEPGWRLLRHVPNRYPGPGDRDTSFADFHIYERVS